MKNLALPIPQTNFADCLIRISIGVFFTTFGVMKLLAMLGGGGEIVGMVQGVFGVEGMLAVMLAWALTLTELIGGAVLALYCIMPRIVFQIAVLGLITVPVVGMVMIHTGDMQQMLWHGMLVGVLVGVLISPDRK